MEMVVSNRENPPTIKKIRTCNLLAVGGSRRPAENILKMKTLPTTKSKAYPNKRFNTLKAVIGSKEIFLSYQNNKSSPGNAKGHGLQKNNHQKKGRGISDEYIHFASHSTKNNQRNNNRIFSRKGGIIHLSTSEVI